MFFFYLLGQLFDKRTPDDDDKYSKFLNSFYRSDTGSTSSSTSNIPMSRSEAAGKIRPAKPPRNKKGRRRFWEDEVDAIQAFSKQNNSNYTSTSSTDETPSSDTDKVPFHERLI